MLIWGNKLLKKLHSVPLIWPFIGAARIALDEPIVYNMVMQMYVCVQLHFYTQLFLIHQNMSFWK